MSVYVAMFIWIAIGLFSAHLAQKRNRSPVVWFFIVLILGVLGMILLALLPAKAKKNPLREVSGSSASMTSHSFSPAEDFAHSRGNDEQRLSRNPRIHWYFMNTAHETQGPLSFDEVKDAYNTGKITPSTPIWNEELDDWLLLKQLSNYDFILGEKPGPSNA